MGAQNDESFLRPLVVQLAEEVERAHGREAAVTAISRVGSDIGARMEDEYRRARGIVERLRPDQIADLFVRLEHAIDGGFSVVDVSDERIVLRNRRCPFGDAVRRAPGLCRMTSSVFGGIAARNAGISTVQLDRRIAGGDQECQVTVWFDERYEGERFGPRPSSREEPSPAALRVVLADGYAYLRAAPTARALSVAAKIRDRFPLVAVVGLAEHLELGAATRRVTIGASWQPSRISSRARRRLPWGTPAISASTCAWRSSGPLCAGSRDGRRRSPALPA